MKNKPLQFCVEHSSHLLFSFFFSSLSLAPPVFVCGIALEHWGTTRNGKRCSDLRRHSQSLWSSSVSPSHLLPRPLEANHSPVSRAPQPNGLDAVCAALLIIQFVAKQLPIWHIWCSSHLVCLNWTMREGGWGVGGGVAFISAGCCYI